MLIIFAIGYAVCTATLKALNSETSDYNLDV